MNKFLFGMGLLAFATAGAADFDIRAFGARTDSPTNAPAIQRAVDAAAARGGGRVVVPAGVWRSGTINVRSHVELHLAKGAVLKGSTDERDYNPNAAFPENFWSAGEEWSGGHLICGYKVEDVALTGEGVIDGSGPAFFASEPEYDSWFPHYKYGLKLHPVDRSWFRPGPMVAFFLSKDIRLRDVTLRDTPCWTAHIRCSDGLDIRGVKILADRTIANSDGFSIDCTRNVVVSNCVLKTGDDGFAIRASCRHHAATNLCENIRISDCDVWSCCYAVRFGIGTGTIRNATVENCRFHESSHAVGFTPSWIKARRNVFIENIRIANCTAGECARPVETGAPNAPAAIRNIVFENCTFSSLLPSALWGTAECPVENVLFSNCTRETIAEVRVRMRRGWCGPVKNRRAFFECGGVTRNVCRKNCRPVPLKDAGALLLSFDDRNFADWERAADLFAKYRAHATFFVSGEIDETAIRALKRLSARGHSIGLHGRHHANADRDLAAKGAGRYFFEEIEPQKRACDVAYIPYTSFAYPNCARNEETDRFFRSHGFAHVRGGIPGLRPYDPKGEKAKANGLKPLLDDPRTFAPAEGAGKRLLVSAFLVGEAYQTDIDEVCACIRRAAEKKQMIAIASHGISPDAKGINMKTAWLEKILKTAEEVRLPVIGFDEF